MSQFMPPYNPYDRRILLAILFLIAALVLIMCLRQLSDGRSALRFLTLVQASKDERGPESR